MSSGANIPAHSTGITKTGSKASPTQRRRKQRRRQWIDCASYLILEMNEMNIELNGRKAMVTGSPAGMGGAAPEGLARPGEPAVVNGRGTARFDGAGRQIGEAFPAADISGLPVDLAQ